MDGDKMAGMINLYVTNEGKVLKIPNTKFCENMPLPELCSQQVLHVQIVYETEDRKPYSVLGAWFDRLSLNELGQYIENKYPPAMQNYINYSGSTVEDLSSREEPLTIPAAPILPTKFEKDCLINYLKSKYPMLWQNSPQVIELAIKSLQDGHKEYIDLFKKASILKDRGKW